MPIQDTAWQRVKYLFVTPSCKHLLSRVSSRVCLFVEGFEHWELTENGGDEWRTEEMPGDCGHTFCDESVTKFFCTSFE